MFLRNAWYVAAWDSELDEGPLARTLLNDPVVLFRGEDRVAVALEDRCCHRHLPLSLGRVVGNEIECGYHGLKFGPTGACTHVPGQTRVPPESAVRAYPLVERWGWLWIWMGDPARADEKLIPDWWYMDHPEWKVIRGNGGHPLPTRCHYELITDNLLDLTHLTYVHVDTLGHDSIIETPVKTERWPDRVRMTRMMPNVEPPPFFKKAGSYAGNVDRWQVVDAVAPCYIDLDVGCSEVGSGALRGDRRQCTTFHVICVPTPETGTSTHFFYAHPRYFALDNAEVDEIFRRDISKVFMEDVTVLEAQQDALDRMPGRPWVDINVDAPAIALRNIIAGMIEGEQG